MPQLGKRHPSPEDELLEGLGEPLAKRRILLHDTGEHAEKHDGLGLSDNLVALEDFSVFFDDDDLDANFPTLADSTAAEQLSATAKDAIEESLLYDEALMGIQSGKTAAYAGVQPPPSSVIRAFDRGSRSADEFDRNLLHSPPMSSSTVTGDGTCEPPDLPLTQEPDWENVQKQVQELTCPRKQLKQAERHQLPPVHEGGNVALLTPEASAPFRDTRVPASPEKISPSKPYRTFFHLKEMVQGKLEMYKNQPQVEFDWYARILYSSRENFYRKQYFQFRDLFKETPPYLSGALLS
ncbi:hypothetical protein G6O67_008206 [Ophiocordyceps sinensis]|uniref:Uncharacterized protein n=1 Tax=Ophiocordyceps sinensis TaxID=72228 RepID=A0A8H4LSC9_9HYPO|nr:hypothetical protein G6O67_008206 [Ophiocordyceps sinensis]